MDLPVTPPVKPTLAKSAPLERALDMLRTGDGLAEPTWGGFRAC